MATNEEATVRGYSATRDQLQTRLRRTDELMAAVGRLMRRG